MGNNGDEILISPNFDKCCFVFITPFAFLNFDIIGIDPRQPMPDKAFHIIIRSHVSVFTARLTIVPKLDGFAVLKANIDQVAA